MEVNAAVGLTGNGAADDVTQGQRGMAFALGLTHRGQGIGGLARLGDGQDDGIAVHGRVAVAELAGVLDLDRDAGKLFEEIFAYQGSMVAGAAGGQEEAIGLAELLAVNIEAAEVSAGITVGQPAAHGILQRLRLLVDLLQHVMRETALVDFAQFRVDLLDAGINAQSIGIQNVPILRRQHAHLLVLEVNDLLRIAQERGRIAGERMLTGPDAEHQRAAQPSPNDHLRIRGAEYGQAVRPLEQRQGPTHRLDQIVRARKRGQSPYPQGDSRLFREMRGLSPYPQGDSRLFREMVGDELGNDFAVGIAVEDHTVILKLALEEGIVFDDPV